jgi:hypothetical protein
VNQDAIIKSENKSGLKAWGSYTACFPLSEIYYYGPKYKLIENESKENESKEKIIVRLDENNKQNNSTKYETYQSIPFVSYNSAANTSLEDWQKAIDNQHVNFKYFSFQPNYTGIK